MFPIAAQICAIQFPPISKVKGWLAGHEFSSERPLVDLCQAVPAYPPAAELTAYLQKVVAEPETARYAPDEGLPEVREAVAKALSGTYAGEVIPEQVCLTIGASQHVAVALRSTPCPSKVPLARMLRPPIHHGRARLRYRP
jgi:aspartate/methionine/tyrosine aminotransferase